MPLSAGTRLGPYEILAPIGAGGMGEVYKARDTRLDRIVAIKVSQEKFTERFEREARAVAALNHPHICTLHDVGPDYLVMEYIDGAPLKGPLPLDQVLKYAVQTCDALDAAHKKGITHRDLKPGNILVTKSGVKLLDFGLAKLKHDATPATSHTEHPTRTDPLTGQGMILGTLQYMAPEQVEGKVEEIDARTDIFALGAVVYEMATGKKAFEGESQASLISAIMSSHPPPMATLQPMTPAPLERAVRKCLAKEPEKRWQAASDLCDELKWIAEGGGQTATPTAARPSKVRERAGWIAAALCLLVAASLAFVYLRETPPEARVVTTTIPPPEGWAFDFVTSLNPPAISPDGRRLVFGARSADGKTQLWIRPFNSRTAQPLAGTESARFAFWSPDSKSIGFFAGGKLKTIDAAGGPPLTLADAPLGHGGSWSPEGVIVFSPNETTPLQRVPASGGTASPATTLDAAKNRSHRVPWFLPDGRHFLFEDWQPGNSDTNIQVASLDSKEVKTVARASSNAIYADGRLLFLRENGLMAQPFDAKRLGTIGDAVPVAEQVGYVPADGVGLFSAASTGLLAYQSDAGGGVRRLTWFDRSGKPVGTLGDAGDFRTLEFSPDRKSLATSVADGSGNQDLWIYDVARGLRTKFTFDPAIDDDPVWSPDGRSIAFRSNRKGHFDLYRKFADGTGAEELLYADNLNKTPGNWSSDGRFLLYHAVGSETADDIWVLPLTPQAGAAPKPFRFLQTPFRELRGKFSPDGRWVAYQSNESQQAEIYVAPFPGPGGKRQISTGGGTSPRWRRDGKEIYYAGPDARLMAAEVNVKSNTIAVGQVRPLGITVVTTGGYRYDASADGQRFLVASGLEQSGAPLTLVENWAAGLKK